MRTFEIFVRFTGQFHCPEAGQYKSAQRDLCEIDQNNKSIAAFG
jgi:hypothetical protein